MAGMSTALNLQKMVMANTLFQITILNWSPSSLNTYGARKRATF
jgi:hypothetical protein